MIKNEWNQLWKKPGLVAALLAIALIPAIYCFLYLSSMWNTYGRVDHIPVAVVNHDQATTVHGRSIDIGRQLTNKLNDSKSMDYHVTTAKAARKGIRTGDYDMVVTIPHDFSKRATTLLTKTPQPALLKFTINSGRNFIVSKMTTGATTAIRANVSKQVSQMNVAALLSAFKGAQVGMATAGQKSGTVTAGLTKISQGLQTVDGENQKLDQQLGANQAAHAIAAQTAGLTAGTQQATAGEQLLTSHLTKGAIQLAQIKQTNKTAKVLASPVESSTTDVAKVPNNGTGMAPFSIAIGVFVGGIGLGTMFDASYSKKHTDSAWW
ncbi:YhgE/Pip domain-containing protein [Furfurilactobacillus sp. WILCCON 0119]